MAMRNAMREVILDRLIDDFHERPLPEPVPRETTLKRVPGKAATIIWMRRAGKTWFCYQDMQGLLAKGVPKERLLYLNFEDERLLPFTAADFQAILDTYYGKFPAFKDELCYFFLDEPQRIEGWELFVRRLLDTERVALCVTGSSSRLLGTEIATSLRGRSLSTEIFPFTFPEFLRYHHPGVKRPVRFGSRTRAMLRHELQRYMRIGGFPEVQTLDDDTRRQVLRSYVDVVVLRDVVERHGVGNVVALRALIRSLLAAPATRFSVSKFYRSLRSQGIACAKNDLYAFMQHLEEAFLVFPVPLHSRSEKKRQVNAKKVYAIDPGLLEATSLRLTEDRGAVLENLVFLHLRQAGYNVEYYVTASGYEVDFVVTGHGTSRRRLLQVCWQLDDEATRERELRGLREAMKELRVSRGTVVTWQGESETEGRIDIIPVWRWLVEGTEQT